MGCSAPVSLAAGPVESPGDPQPADLIRADELFRAGHFTLALDLYDAAVRQQLQAGRDWTRAHGETLFNLGAAHAATGDLAEAVLAFRRALAVFEKLSPQDSLDSALVLEGLAAVLLQQENLAEAERCLDRALTVRQQAFPEHHPQLARLYALKARAAQLRGEDFEKVEELYYRALMAYRRIHGNLHPTVAEIIQNIGTFYTETGFFQAEIMYRQAADVAEALHGPWHPLRAVSLANFGRLRWTEGRFADAEDYLRQALAIHDHLGVSSHSDLAVCLFQLGRVLLARGQAAAAVPVLERAARVYESAWWRAGAGAERSLSVMSPYPLLAAARLKQGDPAGALQAFQAHQGRLAALGRRLQALPPELAARRDSLVLELTDREEQLARRESRGAAHEDLAEARAALAEAEARWLEFQNRAGQQLLPGAGTVAEIGAHLPPDQATVGWLTVEIGPGRHEGWAFALRSGVPVQWVTLPEVPAPWTSPRELARAALDEIRTGDEGAVSAWSALRKVAVAPLEDALAGVRQLVVLPSGFMAGFPVEMLLEQGLEVVYTPVLAPGRPARTGRAAKAGTARVLVVADPPFSAEQARSDAVQVAANTSRSLPEPEVLRSALAGSREAIENLPRLAGTRQEADVLTRLFPATEALLGPQASEPNLRRLTQGDRLSGFDIIHLATHAVIDAERPGRSALVLSQLDRRDDPAADGLLTVREIGRTWRLDAELVTLSACATGLGRRIDGEGYLGFTQSLMAAGARNILVSLWPVDDRATALLMERFYGNLAADPDLPAAAALGEARRWLRGYTTPAGSRPFAAPRFWAGFVMFSSRY